MIKTISYYSFNKLTSFDKDLIVSLSKLRMNRLTLLMKLFTRIGDGYVWGALCLVMFIINGNAALVLTLGSVIQITLQQIIKHIFCRKRPFVEHDDILYLLAPPDKFSFPSGHTAGAFVIVFFLYSFFPMFFGLMLILACLIGISRVYLGLHYPSDILGGIVLGYMSYKIGFAASTLIFHFI